MLTNPHEGSPTAAVWSCDPRLQLSIEGRRLSLVLRGVFPDNSL